MKLYIPVYITKYSQISKLYPKISKLCPLYYRENYTTMDIHELSILV